jgi:DNA-binding protein HU-beta
MGLSNYCVPNVVKSHATAIAALRLGIVPADPMEIHMNHAELSDSVAASLGLSKADAKKAVDAVFAAITEAAAKGDEVSVNGFGKFKIKATPAREGRNPSTGETIQIKAAKKLTFGPAKAVKDRLNG